MNYGWTLEYCLQMPAKKFFVMAKAGREIFDHRMNSFFLEMTDIAPAATGVTAYHKSLREVYSTRLEKTTIKPAPQGYDLSNKDQGMIAAQFLVRGMKGMAGGR